MLDVFEKALTEAGLTWRNPGGNYIESITYNGVTLAEFTNGVSSGWMYTLNGTRPTYGVSEQPVKDGDVIIFHYTDDYTKEDGSQQWNDPNPSDNTGRDNTGKTEDDTTSKDTDTPLTDFPDIVFDDVAETGWYY